MATKTFNIGEYAVGGRIKVDISGSSITIQALDWNTKSVVEEKTFTFFMGREMDMFLNELTSSFYADKIMEWIKTKVEISYAVGGEISEKKNPFNYGDIIKDKYDNYYNIVVQNDRGSDYGVRSDYNGRPYYLKNQSNIISIFGSGKSNYEVVGNNPLPKKSKEIGDFTYTWADTGNDDLDITLTSFDERHSAFINNAPQRLRNKFGKFEEDNYHYQGAKLVRDFVDGYKPSLLSKEEGGEVMPLEKRVSEIERIMDVNGWMQNERRKQTTETILEKFDDLDTNISNVGDRVDGLEEKIDDIDDIDENAEQGGVYYKGGKLDRGLRPSPKESATLYEVGERKIGQDENMYEIVENVNQVKRWQRVRHYDLGGSMEKGGVSKVWTSEQEEKVKLLDIDFEKAVSDKGIERNSKEASDFWREGGFKDRMKRIFGSMEQGGIPNNYEGKTEEQVWDEWTPQQRTHFINDHFKGHHYLESLIKYVKNDWNDFPDIPIKYALDSAILNHILGGQYEVGGVVSKKYTKVEGTEYQLKTEVSYNKGGMNYFSGRTEQRGYYVSVSPVVVSDLGNGFKSEKYTAFSGIKRLVMEVGRKSDSSEKEAELRAQEMIPELENMILAKIKPVASETMQRGGIIEMLNTKLSFWELFN